MADSGSYPKFLFPTPDDMREYYEMNSRGYIKSLVETEDGKRYAIYFVEPIRLQQDLKGYQASGDIYWFEKNAVVLPDITPELINQALKQLWKYKEFTKMKPEE